MGLSDPHTVLVLHCGLSRMCLKAHPPLHCFLVEFSFPQEVTEGRSCGDGLLLTVFLLSGQDCCLCSLRGGALQRANDDR